MTDWQSKFEAWQAYAARIEAMAARIKKMQRDKAFALAATVGLPPHALCIYNASLDRELTGWCKGRPDRLKVARKVNHMLSDWRASNLARALVQKHMPR